MERRRKVILASTITMISFVGLVVFIAYVLFRGFESVEVGSFLLLAPFVSWVVGILAIITYSETGRALDGFAAMEYFLAASFLGPAIPLVPVLTASDQKNPSVDQDDLETIRRL
jgi:hypothetical protein